MYCLVVGPALNTHFHLFLCMCTLFVTHMHMFVAVPVAICMAVVTHEKCTSICTASSAGLLLPRCNHNSALP